MGVAFSRKGLWKICRKIVSEIPTEPEELVMSPSFHKNTHRTVENPQYGTVEVRITGSSLKKDYVMVFELDDDYVGNGLTELAYVRELNEAHAMAWNVRAYLKAAFENMHRPVPKLKIGGSLLGFSMISSFMETYWYFELLMIQGR